MTHLANTPDPRLLSFATDVKRDTERALAFLRDSGTLTASLTFQLAQRVPGEDKVVGVGFPPPWAARQGAQVAIVAFDGTVLHSEGPAALAGARYAPLLERRPEIDTAVHAHTPHLGAWSSAHRVLPLLYVAAQRHTLARELPIYIDRTQPEIDFIVEQLERNPHYPAILEANGGATFWGKGVLKTAQSILLLEEGARLQTIAEGLGGSKEYGPGVLDQQWKMTGLIAGGERNPNFE
ncbi:MAG: class II aldolase/adducin family protein [Solimonas sp.]